MLLLLLIYAAKLWTTASSQMSIPNYGDPTIEAFLYNLDRNLLTSSFADIFSKYATGDNLRETSCLEKLMSLNVNLGSNETSLQQESIECTVNLILILIHK